MLGQKIIIYESLSIHTSKPPLIFGSSSSLQHLFGLFGTYLLGLTCTPTIVTSYRCVQAPATYNFIFTTGTDLTADVLAHAYTLRSTPVVGYCCSYLSCICCFTGHYFVVVVCLLYHDLLLLLMLLLLLLVDRR